MVSRNKLDKCDIDRMGVLSMISQSGFSFERMQAGGFTATMVPGFKKIYGDQKEEVAAAMTSNMGFINTEPHMITFLQGLILSLEEAGEDRDLIQNLRTGLFGPLAGLGDAIFWFTLLPVSAAIASSFNTQGSVLGPIIFVAIWLVAAFSRIWFGRLGYRLGINSLSMLQESGAAITKAAGILGVMVIGGLIPTYVSLSFPEDLMLFGTVSVQGIFDTVLKNILPLGFVFLIYYFLKNKKVSVVTVILGVIVVSVLLSALGIL
mgnify:CR=1 FL=1